MPVTLLPELELPTSPRYFAKKYTGEASRSPRSKPSIFEILFASTSPPRLTYPSNRDAFLQLRTKTFDISFRNRVTVVSSRDKDKALLITAQGFHELKLFLLEQSRPFLRRGEERRVEVSIFQWAVRTFPPPPSPISNGLLDRVAASLLSSPPPTPCFCIIERGRFELKRAETGHG